jgi:hypothetical protein
LAKYQCPESIRFGDEIYQIPIVVSEKGRGVMRLTIVIFMFLLSMSAWAGTYKDDFNDGNWDGWKLVKADPWSINVNEGCSIADGVLRLDATNKPEASLFLSIIEDWKDYSFSADMRLIKTEPAPE